jgi:LysM repeat protein
MRLLALSFGLVSTSLSLLPYTPAAGTSPLQTNASSTYALGQLQISTPSTHVVAVETVGQVLPEATTAPSLPGEAVPIPIIVIVQPGDSLSKIAATHSTTIQRLFDANTFITNPSVINPDDEVRVPFAEEVLQTRPLPPAPKPTPKPQKTAKNPVAQPAPSTAPAVASGSVWDQLAKCESGGNWAINTGNGYYGGLQFLPSTWRAVGGQGLPHQHSREEQILRGQILQARSGWGQWPQCARKLGLL